MRSRNHQQEADDADNDEFCRNANDDERECGYKRQDSPGQHGCLPLAMPWRTGLEPLVEVRIAGCQLLFKLFKASALFFRQCHLRSLFNFFKSGLA